MKVAPGTLLGKGVGLKVAVGECVAVALAVALAVGVRVGTAVAVLKIALGAGRVGVGSGAAGLHAAKPNVTQTDHRQANHFKFESPQLARRVGSAIPEF